MKPIHIVTYCTWSSFGSVLQALGLKQALNKLQVSSRIWLDSNSKRFTKTNIHSLKSLAQRIYQILIHEKRLCAFQKRNAFIEEHLDIDYFSTNEEFKVLASTEKDSIVLAGSDQIWNPSLCNPIFFLADVIESQKISYAASMGHTNLNPHQIKKIGKWINEFDSISVREQECAEILNTITDKPISVHIDPTFLIGAGEWRTYATKYPIKKPYILLYMLYWNDACIDKIKAIKKQTGLPVYAIADGLTGVYADRVLYDVGVGEFLWLIDHADYVITSSFHGTAFSIIFNKRFAPVINPSSPSRIRHLLNTLSLPEISIDQLTQTEKFNYQLTNERIVAEREKSLLYLTKVLSI